MTDADRRSDIVSEFDWELLTFVVQWASYGGPSPEDVLPNFGMTCIRFRERVEEIIDYARRRPHRVGPERRELVGRAAEWLSTLTDDSPYGRPTPAEPEAVDPLMAEGPTLTRGVWRWQRAAPPTSAQR